MEASTVSSRITGLKRVWMEATGPRILTRAVLATSGTTRRSRKSPLRPSTPGSSVSRHCRRSTETARQAPPKSPSCPPAGTVTGGDFAFTGKQPPTERRTINSMKKVEFVYLTYVRTTPEKLWKALTARLCTVAIGCLIGVQAFAASSAATAELKRENNFDSDWRFLKSDAPGAEESGFNDSVWRTLDLPHDWSIEDLPQAATNGSSSAVSATPTP